MGGWGPSDQQRTRSIHPVNTPNQYTINLLTATHHYYHYYHYHYHLLITTTTTATTTITITITIRSRICFKSCAKWRTEGLCFGWILTVICPPWPMKSARGGCNLKQTELLKTETKKITAHTGACFITLTHEIVCRSYNRNVSKYSLTSPLLRFLLSEPIPFTSRTRHRLFFPPSISPSARPSVGDKTTRRQVTFRSPRVVSVCPGRTDLFVAIELDGAAQPLTHSTPVLSLSFHDDSCQQQ